MGHSRFVFHPILANKRSRWIFFWYLSATMIVGGFVWWKINQILVQAGVGGWDPREFERWFLTILLSPHFRYGVILAAAGIAGTMTAHYVIGPIRRIEEWVAHWEEGKSQPPLNVCANDKFQTLVGLLNKLRNKLSPSQ